MAEKKSQMPPKEYSDFLRQVDLESIYFNRFNVKSHRQRLGQNMSLAIKFDTSFKIDEESDLLATVGIKYQLKGYKEKKSEFAIQIDCEIEGGLRSEIPFSEEFLKIYTEVNLNHNTWPYFRTFVQESTNKTGIPALTLPFFFSI